MIHRIEFDAQGNVAVFDEMDKHMPSFETSWLSVYMGTIAVNMVEFGYAPGVDAAIDRIGDIEVVLPNGGSGRLIRMPYGWQWRAR